MTIPFKNHYLTTSHLEMVMPAKPKVLVIGASGFLGRNLMRRLSEANFDVSALDLFAAEGFDHVNWTVGAAGDETIVASAMSGCETVFYLASSSLPASANANMAAEILQHVAVVVKAAEIAKSMGVKKFVFASSGGTVYGIDSDEPIKEVDQTRPRNAYGVSKLAIENYLLVLSHLFEIQTISLRISNPYGQYQKANHGQGFVAAAMSAAFKSQPLTIWGDGSVIRDFVYVDDVAEAFIKAHEYSGHSTCFNIGSGVGRSLLEIVELVEEKSGKKIKVEFSPGRKVDASKCILDINRASQLLNWSPKCGLAAGVTRTADWWRSMSQAKLHSI